MSETVCWRNEINRGLRIIGQGWMINWLVLNAVCLPKVVLLMASEPVTLLENAWKAINITVDN
jgi:hypothetical protein